MRLVVDTNIVFSAILNYSSTIGEILISNPQRFEFFSCNYLKEEIDRLSPKLKKLTKLDENEISELVDLTTANILFINEKIISLKHWQEASRLLQNIDEKDIAFVSLSLHLRAKLWTGDQKLYRGLHKQNFKRVVTTQDLLNKYH